MLESQPVYDGAGHTVGYTGQPVQVCPGPHRPCNAVEVLRSEVLKLEQVAHACPLALNPLSQSLVPKVAVAGALHDGLRARELYVGTKSLGRSEVRTADQQESELRLTQLLVELSVPTSRKMPVIWRLARH